MGTKKRWRDREQPGSGSHTNPGGECIPSTPPEAKHGVTQSGAAAAHLWGEGGGMQTTAWPADGSCSVHTLLNES